MSELPRTRGLTDIHDPEPDDQLRNRLWYVCGYEDKRLAHEISNSHGEALDEVAGRFNIMRRYYRRSDGTMV